MKRSTFIFICDLLIHAITWIIFAYALHTFNSPVWIWIVWAIGVGVTGEVIYRDRHSKDEEEDDEDGSN